MKRCGSIIHLQLLQKHSKHGGSGHMCVFYLEKVHRMYIGRLLLLFRIFAAWQTDTRWCWLALVMYNQNDYDCDRNSDRQPPSYYIDDTPITTTAGWSELLILERTGRYSFASFCGRCLPWQHPCQQIFLLQLRLLNIWPFPASCTIQRIWMSKVVFRTIYNFISLWIMMATQYVIAL